VNAWGPAILSTGTLGAIIPLIIAIMNRRHTQAMAQQVQSAAERDEAERENLLADATAKWSNLLDQTRTEAYKEIKAQCDACRSELQAESGRRQEFERRVYDLEESARRSKQVIRALVLAHDSNDPEAHAEAIALARKLL